MTDTEKFYQKFIKFWDSAAPKELGYVLALGEFIPEGTSIEVRSNLNDAVVEMLITGAVQAVNNKDEDKIIN